MVKFLKIRNVKDPIRSAGNAGIDVFIPEYSREFMNSLLEKNSGVAITENSILLQPTQDILIPSGLKTLFPENIALIATNKSGQATKKRLDVGATCVDSSYRGEIHIHVFNTGSQPVRLFYGEKIIQFVPYLIDTQAIKVENNLSPAEFYGEDGETDRGEGGFGSTGTGVGESPSTVEKVSEPDPAEPVVDNEEEANPDSEEVPEEALSGEREMTDAEYKAWKRKQRRLERAAREGSPEEAVDEE